MNLNEKQAVMLQKCEDHKEGVLTLGGLAGTGKTCVLSEYRKEKPRTLVVAFTGKACSVLIKKGIPAQTIHSAIYDFDREEKKFVKRPSIFCDKICIDEGSMVNKPLWEDLQSYNKPIIVFGDHGQLEPIGNNPYLMKSPDYVLDDVMRTDKLDILDLAYDARQGKGMPRRTLSENFETTQKAFLYDLADCSEGLEYQFLCGFNKTRIDLNKRFRYTKFGKESLEEKNWILPEDRVVCLQNYKKDGLYNGLTLTVEKVYSSNERVATVKFAERSLIEKISKYQFNNPKKKAWHPDDRLFDYSYCMTVHKFQGSEAEKIAVVDEQCDLWNPNNWRYTAITRAKDKLIYGI